MNTRSFANAIRQQLEDRLVQRALVVAALAGLVLCLLLIYYWQFSTRGQSLNANYGRRSGSGADSVNGTSVLAHMFELRGFRVRTADRLSPKLRKTADVIVWAPDTFHGPTKRQREFLEKWLAGGYERTLIYIGRDYDAAADYWQAVQPVASADDATKIAELAESARKSHQQSRSAMPKKEYVGWFTVNSGGKQRQVKELSGPWAEGVVAAQADIHLQGRLDVPTEADAGQGTAVKDQESEVPSPQSPVSSQDKKDDAGLGTGDSGPPELPPDEMEVLLAGDGDPLAFRQRDFAWNEGELIVVANGSFLLNYPLVNPEHRKLAARLIDECSGSEAVFLESGVWGLEILDKDPEAAARWAEIWPLNAMVIHLAVFGIVLCLAFWPIFGRPKTLPTENPADFGRHVASLGQLMARTQNISYAQSRLAQYQQQARRGSGAGHRT